MWSYNYTFPSELYHYGVKGMKWGIRKDIEKLKNPIVSDKIKSGEISTKINNILQEKHMKGMKGYIPGRSYFDSRFNLSDIQTLADKLSGTGSLIFDQHGNWTKKERVNASYKVGAHVSLDGVETRTNKIIMKYSKTRTHMYPGQEGKK